MAEHPPVSVGLTRIWSSESGNIDHVTSQTPKLATRSSHAWPLIDSFPLPLKFPSCLVLPHLSADNTWIAHSRRLTPQVRASSIAVKPTGTHNACDTAGPLVRDSCFAGLAFYCVYNHSGLLPYVPLFSFCPRPLLDRLLHRLARSIHVHNPSRPAPAKQARIQLQLPFLFPFACVHLKYFLRLLRIP